MNLWKLMLHLTLMVVLALGLVACGNDDDDDDSTPANDDDSTPVDDDDSTPANDDDSTPANDDDSTPADDDDDTGCGAPIATDDLVGKTSAIVCLLDPEFEIVEPVGIGPILTGLVSCEDIPPIAFSVLSYEGTTISFVGSDLNPDLTLPAEPTVLAVPPGDFSANPCFTIQVDGEIVLSIQGLDLHIFDLLVEGKLNEGGEGFTNGVLAGVIDPAPLGELLGGQDPCTLLPGVCNAEGLIPLRIENMSAEYVPGVVIPAPVE